MSNSNWRYFLARSRMPGLTTSPFSGIRLCVLLRHKVLLWEILPETDIYRVAWDCRVLACASGCWSLVRSLACCMTLISQIGVKLRVPLKFVSVPE